MGQDIFGELSEKNFLLYAAHHYNFALCAEPDEFNEDVKHFRYLARLFRRYRTNNDDLQERLILNHMILLANVFGVGPATKMMIFKIDSLDYSALKPFLIYLSYYDPIEDPLQLVQLDQKVIDILRNL